MGETSELGLIFHSSEFMQKGEKETTFGYKEGRRTNQKVKMFGKFSMSNCFVSICLLFAFLIQTRARYEKIFLFISEGWLQGRNKYLC